MSVQVANVDVSIIYIGSAGETEDRKVYYCIIYLVFGIRSPIAKRDKMLC